MLKSARVRDTEPAPLLGEQAQGAFGDDRRVLARCGRGPGEASVWQRGGAAKPGRRQPGDPLAAVGEDSVGKLRVDGLARVKALGEGLPVLRQRALGALAADPRGLLGDPAPDDERIRERLAHLRRLDGAAAQRDQAAAAERRPGPGAPRPRESAPRPREAKISATGFPNSRSTSASTSMRLAAQNRRRALCRAGLAGPHEADERDRWSLRPGP